LPRSWTRADRRLRRALLALTLALPAFAAPPATAAPSTAAAPYREALLRELNRVRDRHSLPPVRADRRLDRGATAHSRDMAANAYFAHGPWTTRVRAAAGSASRVGEVLGWLAVKDPRQEAAWLVSSWLRSPPHRAVLLERDFGRVGIGRVIGTWGGGSSAGIYTADFASAR
jgi:uncharacterized protein YkwD